LSILNQTTSLSQKIIDRRNNPYKNSIDPFYEARVDFHYAEVDYVYEDVDLEIGFLLTMGAIFRVGSSFDLAAYTMDNPYVMSLEYNIKNQILIVAKKALYEFIDNLNNLADKEKNKMMINLIICFVVYLSFVLLQFVFIALENYTIFLQAELMLLLPPKNCKEQERIAKEFLTIIHLGTLDVEQMSEDDYSMGSDINSVKSGRRKKNYSLSVSMRNMDGRKFISSTFRKIGYVWRSLLFFCLLGGYLLTTFLVSNAHFNTITDISEIYQLSVHFVNHLNEIQNGVMVHYITPEMPIYQKSSYDFILEKVSNLHTATNYLLEVLFSVEDRIHLS
jgi:hypothetical protein